MNRLIGVALLPCVVLLVAGCGGGGGNAALPDGGGQAFRVGNLEVQTEASAGFKTMALKSAPGADVAMTVLYGAKITKLSELRRLEKIVFQSARNDHDELYSMNMDGSATTRLTNNGAGAQRPSWSPDGKRIAFQRGGADYEIWTMNADGSGAAPVTDSSAHELGPAWSPDGISIAFEVTPDGGDPEIHTMHSDGSSQRRLTTNSVWDSDPCWAPDGVRLAFTTRRDGNDEIYTMYADGSVPTRVTTNSDDDEQPAWSPDGRRIAFSSFRYGNSDIYSVNADGTGLVRLTSEPAPDLEPVWSRDGSRIIFTSHRDGNGEIYAMNADGSGQIRLTDAPDGDGHPNCCPALSAPETWRTVIGPSGSDLGSSPPFGTYRYMAIVGFRADEGVVSAAALAIPGTASAVVPEALDYGGGNLVALKLTGSPVYGIVEDEGRGKPTTFWDTETTSLSAGALLVFFSANTGRVQTIIASTDTASTAGAAASLAARASGAQVVLTGAFTAAYDAEDRDGNRVSGTASKIVLEESTGRIISVD